MKRFRPGGGGRARALAAALVAAVLGGYWWRDAVDGARSSAAPRADLALVELRPAGHAMRGDADAAAALIAGLPALLVLPTDDVTPYTAYRLELRDGSGALLWQGDDARRQEPGDFVLHLPAGTLPAGALEVRLFGMQGQSWRLVERYPLNVVARRD